MDEEDLQEAKTIIRRYDGTLTRQPIQFVQVFCMVREMYAEVVRLKAENKRLGQEEATLCEVCHEYHARHRHCVVHYKKYEELKAALKMKDEKIIELEASACVGCKHIHVGKDNIPECDDPDNIRDDCKEPVLEQKGT